MAAGAVVSDKTFVYFVNAAGKIIPAPDSRVTAAQVGLGPEWRRCEATGAKEIEKVSLVLSRQMWEEKKARTVAQHLREKAFIDQVKARCRIRAAQQFSKNDESINKQIFAKIEQREEALYRLIVSEFDPTNRHTALDVELREAAINPHHLGQKKAGIA